MEPTGAVRATVALCLVVAACACGSGDSGGRTPNTFRSRTYGYSIAYPAGWAAIPATEELQAGQPPFTGPPITDVIARRPDRVVRRMDLPALVVGAQPVAEGTTIVEWTATVTDVASNQKHCGEPAAMEKLKIGGEQAVLLSYPDCPRGAHLNHFWAAVVHGNRGFHMVFFDTVGHEDADRALLHRMLSRVSFE